LADALGMAWAIGAIAGVTALSGVVAAVVMYETHPIRRRAQPISTLRAARIDPMCVDEGRG